jgi:hypothetical protein
MRISAVARRISAIRINGAPNSNGEEVKNKGA